jgi:hypothetical protein
MTRFGAVAEEDVHFYIDHAPPAEVVFVLRALGTEVPLSPADIAERLATDFGFPMQRDRTYSPRRLLDLGLACRGGATRGYLVTPLGSRVRDIQMHDPTLAADVFHYLHYNGYSGEPDSRKYLWSYRTCCQMVWHGDGLTKRGDLASRLITEIESQFPWLDPTASRGARFTAAAVGEVYSWLRELVPAPVSTPGVRLVPRVTERSELALLALDLLYRARGYSYGDPVILDEALSREFAGAFFLDAGSCVRLLRVAARLSGVLKMTDTLAGPAVHLLRPYTIQDL